VARWWIRARVVVARFVDRYAPLIAAGVCGVASGVFWGAVTYWLGSEIWWVLALLAGIMTEVMVMVCQLSSIYEER